MRFAMRVLSDGGITFDPPIVIDSTVPLKRRAIYVTAHYPINNFFLRHAVDQGFEPVVVKQFPGIDTCAWGTRKKYDAFRNSPAVLVKLRRRIEAGHPALVLIEHVHADAIAFHSEYGDGTVDTLIFEFARRFDIPVFFLCVRCDESGRPVIVIRSINADANEFVKLLLEQAKLLRR